jgi:hypothetical protein
MIAQNIRPQAMIPTAQSTIHEPVQRETMRSVWFVTPVTPGNQPLENSCEVQPVSEAIRTANTGRAAHLNRGLRGTIDPSLSFRYIASLLLSLKGNRLNTKQNGSL